MINLCSQKQRGTATVQLRTLIEKMSTKTIATDGKLQLKVKTEKFEAKELKAA